jgi:hypothetical protein
MKTFSHLRQFLAEFVLWWEVFQWKLQKKLKHTFYIQSCFSENRAINEQMSKNTVGAREATNDNTAWRMRCACWVSIPAPLHTHAPGHAYTHRPIYNTDCVSTTNMVLRTRMFSGIQNSPRPSQHTQICEYTSWFKYDRDKLWLVYTQIVPVIFEPPCIFIGWKKRILFGFMAFSALYCSVLHCDTSW